MAQLFVFLTSETMRKRTRKKFASKQLQKASFAHFASSETVTFVSKTKWTLPRNSKTKQSTLNI
jgi:hypothetical protein